MVNMGHRPLRAATVFRIVDMMCLLNVGPRVRPVNFVLWLGSGAAGGEGGEHFACEARRIWTGISRPVWPRAAGLAGGTGQPMVLGLVAQVSQVDLVQGIADSGVHGGLLGWPGGVVQPGFGVVLALGLGDGGRDRG